jgi:hypothetical protein
MSALRKLLGRRAVAYYPELARALGGIAPALFLQQIAHWEASSNDGWVFRTQEELEAELAMSPKAQRSCRDVLVAGGFLKEERRAKNRLHYRVDWAKVEAAVQSVPPGRSRVSHRAGLDVPDGHNSLKRVSKESKDKNSPRGAGDRPAKIMTSLTVERTKEVGFDAAPYQKANWGNGWAAFVYVPEGETPPSTEHQYAVLGEIVAAAAGRRGKARFFLSVEDAIKRLEKDGREKPNSPPVSDLESRRAAAEERRRQMREVFG